MKEIPLPYGRIAFCCQTCALVLTDIEKMEKHEKEGTPLETAEIVSGETVIVDDTLWQNDWHELRLPSVQEWIVMEIFYNHDHKLMVMLMTQNGIGRAVRPYRDFARFWIRHGISAA